jgi:hypothetical protein
MANEELKQRLSSTVGITFAPVHEATTGGTHR